MINKGLTGNEASHTYVTVGEQEKHRMQEGLLDVNLSCKASTAGSW